MSELPIKTKLPVGFLDEEVRCGYTVSSEMKAVWAVELDLLKQIDSLCGRHGIQYYACAGTMLGAVRHKGMIPWDDDIDIMLLRSDYEKFCNYANEFEEPYFFQTEFTDRSSMRGHAQLRNSETTAILEYDKKFKFNQGIFIDIFPLDNIPDEEQERKKFFRRLSILKNIMRKVRHYTVYKNTSSSKLKNIIVGMATPILLFSDCHFSLSHNLYKRYEMLMKSYNGENTKEVGILAILEMGDRFIWDICDFKGEVKTVPFEFMDIPLPNGYLNMLTKTYGEWNKPVKAGSCHGGVLFDPYSSYTNYIGSNSKSGTTARR